MTTLTRVSLTCIGIAIGATLAGCEASVDDEAGVDELASADQAAPKDEVIQGQPGDDEENLGKRSDAWMGWGGLGWGGLGWGGLGWGTGFGWGTGLGWGWPALGWGVGVPGGWVF